ncbi:MAG TPA: hypothetical protein VGM47_10185 [Gammaproteobacteria bacterium]|jgi:hypothetical protein
MKKLLLIILGASMASLAACGGMSTTSDNEATVLQTGQHGAISDVTEDQYHNQADFKAGWDKAYAGQSEPALPTVDFTKNTVALFALGEHTTGGYKVRVIQAAAAPPSGYNLGFEVTIPGIGCLTTTHEPSKPFIFVSVPTTVDITFVDAAQRRQPDCTAK